MASVPLSATSELLVISCWWYTLYWSGPTSQSIHKYRCVPVYICPAFMPCYCLHALYDKGCMAKGCAACPPFLLLNKRWEASHRENKLKQCLRRVTSMFSVYVNSFAHFESISQSLPCLPKRSQTITSWAASTLRKSVSKLSPKLWMRTMCTELKGLIFIVMSLYTEQDGITCMLRHNDGISSWTQWKRGSVGIRQIEKLDVNAVQIFTEEIRTWIVYYSQKRLKN